MISSKSNKTVESLASDFSQDFKKMQKRRRRQMMRWIALNDYVHVEDPGIEDEIDQIAVAVELSRVEAVRVVKAIFSIMVKGKMT